LRGAVFAREPVRPHIGVTLIRELPLCRQLIQHTFEHRRRLGVRRELAYKFSARMLAPREKPQRPYSQLYGRVGPLALQAGLGVAAALTRRKVLDLLVHRGLLDLFG